MEIEDMGLVKGSNGVSVTNVQINAQNHLIVTLSDGSTIDAGEISGGGGGESSVMIVTFTHGASTGYTSDKTMTEISYALSAGKLVVGYYDGHVFECVTGDSVSFERISAVDSDFKHTRFIDDPQTVQPNKWLKVEAVYPVFDHDALDNRDSADQHPMSAITGLENAVPYIVRITYAEGEYHSDKTYDEIVEAALSDKKLCFAEYGGVVYSLSTISGAAEVVTFTQSDVHQTGGNSYLYVWQFSVSNDEVTFTEKSISLP